ncbi:MAG: pyridoxal 5'-phosphate synthase, partial [Planctomycetota bacterium]
MSETAPILPSAQFERDEQLPDTLPQDPFPTIQAWMDEAFERKASRNPNAMTIATVDESGRPSARVVLCKGIDVNGGWIVFYTNRNSRKGRELDATRRAACVLHWDAFERQVRIEGPVIPSPEAESDAYFNSRHPASRIGAWASNQSAPLESRDDLMGRIMEVMGELGVNLDDDNPEIPRP